MMKSVAKKERDRKQREYERSRREQEARGAQITTQFEDLYGRDETKLEKWQRLCRDVGVPEGASINKCKKELKGVYINIVDFVEAQREGRKVHLFRSYNALQNYMLNNKGKIYPIKAAKDSPILKWMLVQVF